MSDNLMCECCPGSCVNLRLKNCGAGAFISVYCGIPAICLDLKCWEVKKCEIGENLNGRCSELLEWKKKNPSRCEFCGAICIHGHHFDKCPNSGKILWNLIFKD